MNELNILLMMVVVTTVPVTANYKPGLRGIVIYTYDAASLSGSELYSQEVNGEDFEKILLTKEIVKKPKSLESSYDFLSLLNDRCDIQIKCEKKECERTCPVCEKQQCETTRTTPSTTLSTKTTPTRSKTTPTRSKTTPTRSNTTPTRSKTTPTRSLTTTSPGKIITSPETTPLKTSSTTKTVTTTKSTTRPPIPLCKNGGFGPYCCKNGVEDNPDCCENGGKGKYCCINGENNPNCDSITKTSPLITTPTKTASKTSRSTTFSLSTTKTPFTGKTYIPIATKYPPTTLEPWTGTYVRNTGTFRQSHTWVPYTHTGTWKTRETTPIRPITKPPKYSD